MAVTSELGAAARLFRDLPGFLAGRLDREACERTVRHDLARREENLLDTLRRGVFAFPERPYARLFRHAGLGYDDVAALVARCGVEDTLAQLRDAGVYVTLGEFKGRVPIRRGSLEVHTRPHDFDNPLAVRHLQTGSGGSRGAPTRLFVDLAHYARDAIYIYLAGDVHGFARRRVALWRPPPPYSAGLKLAMKHLRAGRPVARWFAQRPLRFDRTGWKYAAVTRSIVATARMLGHPLATPEHVPLAEAHRIAAWIAEVRRSGATAAVDSNAASLVRLCRAAIERGIDISGTLFRSGGEPLTDTKRRVIGESGCRVVAHYSMSETGMVGVGCGDPQGPDDVHMLLDKLAVITRRKGEPGGPQVEVNLYTTLVPTPPRLLVNFESDDYGRLEHRQCGCPFGALGYSLHLREIRSWDKLTSEGMTFVGDDLIRLLEEILPARFGGGPGDYQFVEREGEDGLPRVELLASPRLGPIDEGEAVETVIGFLNNVPRASDAYGERWRQADTLRLRRAEPHATFASKILPLHVARKGSVDG